MTEIACVVDAYDALGECCLWCPTTRRVWWLDILKPCLQSLSTRSSGEHQVYPLPGKTAAAPRCGSPAASCWRPDNGLHGFDPATGN